MSTRAHERAIAAAHQVDVAGDSAFQRRARLLQALWREDRGLPIGVHRRPGGHEVRLGSRLAMPGAEQQGWNSLTPSIAARVADEVTARRDPLNAEGKLFGYPRIFDDLLSSQPMCFNLFAELDVDRAAASAALQALWPSQVDAVTRIRFEHSPGRGDPKYLGNRSAADVFIEHTVPGGGRGFIAIETKYHEDLRVTAATHKERYTQVAEASGAFAPGALDAVAQPPLQQIWLDHLLALSILQRDGATWVTGRFVLLHPERNERCVVVGDGYVEHLTETGRATFERRTLEEVVAAIASSVDGAWVDEFRARYLDFARADAVLAADAP